MNQLASLLCASILVVAVAAAGCSGHDASPLDGPSKSGSSGSSSSNAPGHSPEGDALFQAPSGGVTPGTIFGLWGGTIEEGSVTFDSRMKLTATSITLATRCTLTSSGAVSGIVSVTAAARVTDDSVVILETKNDAADDGVVRCRVTAAPREMKRCRDDQPSGFEQNCFTVEGTTFTTYGTSPLDKAVLVKLSD
jgi:hypothetical protein